MKRYIFFSILTASLIMLSCKKGTDPVDGSNATVELKAGAKNITGDVTVNGRDTLVFDFTITSPQEMGFVSIQRNPVNQTAFLVRDTLRGNNKFSYSATRRIVADSANGSSLYRIVAHTSRGIYIGHRDVVVTVRPDFNFYTNRTLFSPDTTGRNNKSFFSASDGATFSYNEGNSNSGKIDFGYFYDTTRTGNVVNGHTIYAISAGSFTAYDFSNWTRNATVLRRLASGSPNPTFAQVLSAGTLRTAGVLQLSSGTTSRVTGLSTSSPANTVYFRTVSGKVGMIQVNFASVALNANGGVDTRNTFVNIDVKIEK